MGIPMAVITGTEMVMTLIDVAFKIAEVYKIPPDQVALKFQAKLAEFKKLNPSLDIKDV